MGAVRPSSSVAAAGDGQDEWVAPDDLEHLSAREMAVVRRAMAGQALKAIASELEISSNTAATYLTRARRKLRLASRWKLSAFIWRPLPGFSDVAARELSFTPTCAELALGDMLLAGLSNAEIAQRDGTDRKVTARHVAALLKRAGLKTRLDLFSRALNVKAGRTTALCQKHSVGPAR